MATLKSYAFIPLNFLLSVSTLLADNMFELISALCLAITTGFAAFKYYHEARKAQAEKENLQK